MSESRGEGLNGIDSIPLSWPGIRKRRELDNMAVELLVDEAACRRIVCECVGIAVLNMLGIRIKMMKPK